MKIKIKLNIELKDGVFEDYWGSSILEWKECWLQTKYVNRKADKHTYPFECYIYPSKWEEKEKIHGHVLFCGDTKYIPLKTWVKDIEGFFKKHNPQLLK